MRALVSKGWGNFGGNSPPKDVFLLGNVPHDWLFPRVSAVVHHGGAGTTAIGIMLGKPTVVVPFFGDQLFWGNMIYRAGAGPMPVAYKKLDSTQLAESIKVALKPETRGRAHELAEKIKNEDGPAKAAQLFQSTPQMKNLGCFILRDRVAVWRVRRTNIQLSSLTAGVLVTHKKLKPEQLKLARHKRWYVDEGSQDPLVGIIGAFSTTATGLVSDVQHFSKALSRKSSRVELRTAAAKASSEESGSAAHSSVNNHNKKTRNTAMIACAFAGSSAVHVAKLPVALTYNLANGFHNLPAQVGDTTVRVRDPITGIASGMRVGGKEFVYGILDGFSGVVTQPYRGYQDGKGFGRATGVAKGVGLGVVGLVSKVPAAIIGPFGYGGKGVERQLQRWWAGSDLVNEEEVEQMVRAEDKVQDAELDNSDLGFTRRARQTWEQARGTGQSKRIVERRVWQGYREMTEMRQSGEVKELEQLVLQRWEELHVDEKFLATLRS